MLRFRRMRSLQMFATVHTSVTNHQNRPQPLQPIPFQAEPRHYSRRVARPWRRIRGSVAVLAETGSNPSDRPEGTPRCRASSVKLAQRRTSGRKGECCLGCGECRT